MIIDYENKFVILLNTRAASDTTELMCRDKPDVALLTGHPIVKHFGYADYNDIKVKLKIENFTTIGVARRPFDKLISWYDYRSRPSLNGHPDAMKDRTLEQYYDICCTEKSKCNVFDRFFFTDERDGSQADMIFSFDYIELFFLHLEKYYGKLSRDVRNASIPRATPKEIADLRPVFKQRFYDETKWHQQNTIVGP